MKKVTVFLNADFVYVINRDGSYSYHSTDGKLTAHLDGEWWKIVESGKTVCLAAKINFNPRAKPHPTSLR